MKRLLYFHSLDECMMFDPTTGLWDRRPLHLSLADQRRLQHMKMVCTDTQSLFFVNRQWDQLLLYNTITRRCSPVPETGPRAAARINNARRYTVKAGYPSDLCLALSGSFNFSRDGSQTGRGIISVSHRIATSNTASFQLFLSEHHRIGARTVTLKLLDSRLGYSLSIHNVPREFHFIAFPTTVLQAQFGPAPIMLGFYRTPVRGRFNILVYDIQIPTWRWLRGRRYRLLDHPAMQTRKTVFGTISGTGDLEFAELSQEGAITKLVTTTFPQPITAIWRRNRIRQALRDGTVTEKFSAEVNFVPVQQGDILFFICLFRESGRGPLHVSVRTQNQRDGSERISPWEQWLPSAWNSPTRLPSSDDFHILDQE